MIDFSVPDDLRDVGEGLVEFLRRVVEPLEEEHRALWARTIRVPDGTAEIQRRTRPAIAARASVQNAAPPRRGRGRQP